VGHPVVLQAFVAIPPEILHELPVAIDAVLDNERKVIRELREKGYGLEAHRKSIQR
jgi:hypothetical protein